MPHKCKETPRNWKNAEFWLTETLLFTQATPPPGLHKPARPLTAEMLPGLSRPSLQLGFSSTSIHVPPRPQGVGRLDDNSAMCRGDPRDAISGSRSG